MINIVFSKMEAYSGNFGISLGKLQQRSAHSRSGGHTPSLDDGGLSEKSLTLKGSIISES
jgi:hypothetical protein